MKASKDAACRAGVIVLNELGVDSDLMETVLVVGFHEEAAGIAEDRRLDQKHAR